MRRSSGSTRPPGKTNLPGMNLWPPCRLPISTLGSGPSRSTMISVAASRGRSARPGTATPTHLSSPPNPCMPNAHCWPTTAPFMRGRRRRLTTTVTVSQSRTIAVSDAAGQALVGHQHPGAGDVAHDEHGQIGRRVVGARVAEVLAADLAARVELEIAAEQAAAAAGRAAADAAALDRLAERALASRARGSRGTRTCRSSARALAAGASARAGPSRARRAPRRAAAALRVVRRRSRTAARPRTAPPRRGARAPCRRADRSRGCAFRPAPGSPSSKRK